MRVAKAITDVQLERQVEAHAAELYPVLADARLHEFTDDDPPFSLEMLAERFRRLESRTSADGSQAWLNWVVRRRDGKAIGYVQATIYPDHVADIAYVLGYEFWGAGLALSAVRAMISDLAANHGVSRLRASVDPRNSRSLRLLSRVGLSPVGQPQKGDVILEADVADVSLPTDLGS